MATLPLLLLLPLLSLLLLNDEDDGDADAARLAQRRKRVIAKVFPLILPL